MRGSRGHVYVYLVERECEVVEDMYHAVGVPVAIPLLEALHGGLHPQNRVVEILLIVRQPTQLKHVPCLNVMASHG